MPSPAKQAAAHRAAATLATPKNLGNKLAAALQALLPSMPLSAIERLLRTGNADEIAERVPWEVLEREMAAALDGAGPGIAAAGVRSAGNYLPALDLTPERLSELADGIASRHAAEFVTAITESDRQALRQTIRQAVKVPGVSRRQLAREIRGQIGLNRQQQRWLGNAADRWRAEVGEGRMTLAGMNQRIDRLQRRYLRNRADLIAQHESRSIFQRAQRATYKEAGVVGADGVFIGTNGGVSSGPPGPHINCNCATTTVIRDGVLRIQWIAGPQWCAVCDEFNLVLMS